MSTRSTSILRGVLLGVVPLVAIAVAGVMYASGGRYVTSENAYVKADIIQISPQVEGRVAEVLVRENARVNRGDVLFRLDRRPFEIARAEAEAELAAVRHRIASMRADYKSAVSESDQNFRSGLVALCCCCTVCCCEFSQFLEQFEFESLLMIIRLLGKKYFHIIL